MNNYIIQIGYDQAIAGYLLGPNLKYIKIHPIQHLYNVLTFIEITLAGEITII